MLHDGAIWAEASGGDCLFGMPTERNFALMDETTAKAKPVWWPIVPWIFQNFQSRKRPIS